jgi:hypothetical protein
LICAIGTKRSHQPSNFRKSHFAVGITMKNSTTILAAIAFCVVGSVYAISFGGPGGDWPKNWPEELDPLREKAWNWTHGDSGEKSYDIPFANREEFEAAWPHILTLKGKGETLTLLRGDHVRAGGGETAGVRILLPQDYKVVEAEQKPSTAPVNSPNESGAELGPGISIVLVVDGEIVDLNRIPLPGDTVIVDRRFEKP